MANTDKKGSFFQKIKEKIKNVIGELTKKENLKKICIVAAIGVVAIILIIIGVLGIARCTGKKSLYDRVEGQSMNFDKNDTDVELDIDMDIMDEDEDETESVLDGIGETSTKEDVSNDGGGIEIEETTQGKSEATTDKINENETGKIVQNQDENEDGYDITYNGIKYKYNEDIMTFLILGIDKNEKVSPAKDGISGGQSDGIYLVVMNPHTNKIDLITVHRDTIARIWVYDKEGNFVQTGKAQICLQHGYGDGMELSNERAKKAVSDLFYDLPIHSVTSVNMGAIGMLNDAIGGVTLESLETFSKDGYSFKKGEIVTLKGKGAYYYTKYRDISEHYTAGKRLERQKQYLSMATTQTMSAIKKDVGVLVDIYKIAKDYVVTDLSIDEMTYIATELGDYEFGQIYSPEGYVDTSRTYERYYLDIDKFEQLIIGIFYEEVR